MTTATKTAPKTRTKPKKVVAEPTTPPMLEEASVIYYHDWFRKGIHLLIVRDKDEEGAEFWTGYKQTAFIPRTSICGMRVSAIEVYDEALGISAKMLQDKIVETNFPSTAPKPKRARRRSR